MDVPVPAPTIRRRERRRLLVAIASTVVAVPLLLVEIAPGVDASPDSRPASFVAEVTSAQLALSHAPKAMVQISGEDLAEVRLFGVFSGGEHLRAVAAAEEAEAELARQAEEERLRRIEEREAAAEEAARRARQEREAAERAATEAAAEAAANQPAPAATPPPPGGPTPEQWQALRMCESTNNYQAISPNRLYYGAYQFYQGTWDNTARNAGRADLVGVSPHQASPADQDAMAYALYQSRGHRPWPHCGVHLR